MYDMTSTQNSVSMAKDDDGDGFADYLYFKTWYEEGYYMCDPGGAAVPPFTGTSTSCTTPAPAGSYGMGFDRTANVLWAFEDTNEDLVMIQ